jgi:hypothetical protein
MLFKITPPHFFTKLLLAMVILSVIGVASCTKIDLQKDKEIATNSNLAERFFNEHRTTDPIEAKLVNFVKHKYANENIVDKVIKIVGFPRWDKTTIYKDVNASFVNNTTTTTTNTYYIPLVIDSQNFVNAAMAIQTNATDTTLTFLQSWQYINKQNNINSATDIAENYAVFFMRQDRHVFGYNTYKILDTSLFRFNNQKVDSVTLSPEVIQSNNLISMETTCLNATYSFPCSGMGGNIINQNGNTSNTAGCYLGWSYCTTTVGDTGPTGGGGGTSAPSNPPSSSGSSNTPGGGTGWAPVLTGINYLTQTLSLTPAEIAFLNQYPFLKEQLYYYNSISPSEQKKIISKQHINKLMNDPSYLLFCQNQSNNSDSGKVWWEDLEWLTNNFSLSVDNQNSSGLLLPPNFEEFLLIAIYPIEAFKINQNATKAQTRTIQLFGQNGLNDKSDAFRHTFWLALNTKSILSTLALAFSNAHETSTPAQFNLEKQMDLHNNGVGISICGNPAYLTEAMLSDLAFQAIQNGDCVYLSPTLPPPFYPNGTPNPNGDPCYWGCSGNSLGTHGIIASTHLIPTNQ